MRITDKKGAIFGTVLAIIIIATMLLVIAFIDVDTAKAETIEYVNNFTLEYGRIENINVIEESYSVILTYYSDKENEEGINTVSIDWDGVTSSLWIDGVQEDLFNTSILWTYTIKVWSESMKDIEAFSRGVDINSDRSLLLSEGIGYYRTDILKDNINSRYIAEEIRGVYIFIGNDIKVSQSITIFNKHFTNPNPKLYDTILCTNVRNVVLPPLNGSSANLTLEQVCVEAKPMYTFKSDYMAGIQQGYIRGYNEAYRTVEVNSASYIAGYNAGQEGEYTFLNLLTAVVDAPVKAVSGIFNIEILGYNMQIFITALLTISLAMFIVRKLGGGL